ncbi:MAG: group 1 glycosyl transferase, partial [Alcaligenaceae bacterium]
MPSSGIRWYARKLAKGIWWAATPWRTKERLQFIRSREAAELRAADLALFAAHERDRVGRRKRGEVIAAPQSLDLFDDQSTSDAAGLSWSALAGPRVQVVEIVDKWSAARFCIDLLRSRSDLRSRFPTALSGGKGCEFGAWLRLEGA